MEQGWPTVYSVAPASPSPASEPTKTEWHPQESGAEAEPESEQQREGRGANAGTCVAGKRGAEEQRPRHCELGT